MNSMYGAEVGALRRAAQQLRSEADRLEAEAAILARQLGALQWLGGVAVRFADLWQQAHAPHLVVTSRFLRESAAALDRNADQQEGASSSRDQAFLPTPIIIGGAEPVPERGPGATELLEYLIGFLGMSAGAADALLALLNVANIDAAWLKGFLEKNGDFISLLGDVISVADVVTNLVTDFAENPDLPMDERALHAIVEAGVRYALSEGIEMGVEAITVAIGTAIGGPVGTAAGHLIGDLIGGIVADQLSGVTEGVAESVADGAVDAYRTVKDGMEQIIDIGEDIVEGGQRIIEGAIDIGGNIIDNVGGFIGGLW